MSNEHSIVNFLKGSGVQLRILDMGRRIEKITSQQFFKIEQGHTPYPLPYLHQAWIALLLWNPKNKSQNAVWFLKLPLDEQGFLVQAARDDIMNRLLQNIQFAQGDLTENQDALKDNPFVFKPDQEKMAAFHAIANQQIGLEASAAYPEVLNYLKGNLQSDTWQSLSLQGIADFVTRLDEGRNEALLTEAIANLPLPVLTPTCVCLEHAQPSNECMTALNQRLESYLADSDTDSAVIAALLRGLSNGQDQALKNQLLTKVLSTSFGTKAEVLVTVATRYVDSLRFPDTLLAFLEALAKGESGQAGFSRILADLMFMPDLRALVLHSFRNPNRSEALTTAIGEMFGDGIAKGH